MQNPKFQKAVSIVRETPTRVRQLRVPKPRDLRTELRKQSAEEYWSTGMMALLTIPGIGLVLRLAPSTNASKRGL